MKIFSAKQLLEADKITQKNQKITSLELMERASQKIFSEINHRLNGAQIPIKVFCGIGNNGGDGLVVARKLINQGYKDVKVFIVNYSDKRSKGFLENYSAIKDITKDWPVLLAEGDDFPEITPNDFVVDAIFGIGLNRPLPKWVSNLIDHINKSQAFVVAIDMPSGMMANDRMDNQSIIEANYTLTFQAPKLAFFLPETAPFAGNVQVIDIGIDQQYIAETQPEATIIGKEQVLNLYQPRTKFSHKGSFGHLLMIGGSYGMMGSITLATKAGYRIGTGKVTAVVPKCGYQIVQTNVPEALVKTSEDGQILTSVDLEIEQNQTVCFGPGAGTDAKTIQFFDEVLGKTKKSMLIDADGINMLGINKDLIQKIPHQSVLTPHPKELEQLIGPWKNDFEKIMKTKEFSTKYNLVVVIKDAYTITVAGENLFINVNGNPGLATAGSGDVLSGIIAGLMAQNYDPTVAAVFGVYLHANTADIIINQHMPEYVIASDLIDYLGLSLRSVFEKPKQQPQQAQQPSEN
ncbi:NAD(P)H-hydrate dehydratase [Mesonia sp. K7]|uniref:NAD(P)H-hydrate dehydratase n=1 Tax=Mesonia sp. K7 TaxID=2218606 RepID=UPI000DAA786A|nr:NAD(P)H-hydrate dehydratase [Mesonia sp. K7]PZD79262.1 bifunctional ADP-dependent NAD(P)H-hydrate dehydratase/NAD(P)H-hydrate epimerase [Mesonia sp. K7]